MIRRRTFQSLSGGLCDGRGLECRVTSIDLGGTQRCHRNLRKNGALLEASGAGVLSVVAVC